MSNLATTRPTLKERIIQSLEDTNTEDGFVDTEQAKALNALIQFDANDSKNDATDDASYAKNANGRVNFDADATWIEKLATVSDADIEAFVTKFGLDEAQEMKLRDSFTEACMPGCKCGM